VVSAESAGLAVFIKRQLNPGRFEPFVYLLKKPAMFRVIGLGGFVLFTILAFAIAASLIQEWVLCAYVPQ
jgi:hypothetical protein